LEYKAEFFCNQINSETKVIIEVVSRESFAGLTFSLGSRCKEREKCSLQVCSFIKNEEAKMIEQMKSDYEIEKAIRQKENEWKF